jgi:4-amino-4-deoxy-L-arabinose transferase-like glycosyltransferase
VLVLAAIAGVALRVGIYLSSLGKTESDEAIIGLMVRHALHGQFSTFQWGVAYGGTQEVLLTVPIYWIFGTSLLGLRIVPILLDVVTAVLVWRVGRRTIGEPAARVAGALYWIWPAFVVYEHTRQDSGFYASDTFYCALILLLALRASERPDALRVGTFGLVLGLAFWQTSQTVPIAAAAVAWLLWRRPQAFRQLWLAVPLAILGALPWLIWNASNHWASLHLNAGASYPYFHRLRIFFSDTLPEALGLRVPFSMSWLVPRAIAAGIYVILLASFAHGAYRRRRKDVLLLYAVAGLFPFLYAASPKTIVESEPRYAIVLSPCIVLLIAQIATTFTRAALLLGLAGLVSVAVINGMNTWGKGHPDPTSSTPRSLSPLIASLDRLAINRVFANYWIAYQLDFASRERIIAVENGFNRLVGRDAELLPTSDPRVRYPPYQREVRAGSHGFVFFRNDLPAAPILGELQRYGYTRHLVERFVVYAPPARTT